MLEQTLPARYQRRSRWASAAHEICRVSALGRSGSVIGAVAGRAAGYRDGALEQCPGRVARGAVREPDEEEADPAVVVVQRGVGGPDVDADLPGTVLRGGAPSGPVEQPGADPTPGVVPVDDEAVDVDRGLPAFPAGPEGPRAPLGGGGRSGPRPTLPPPPPGARGAAWGDLRGPG